MRTLVVPDLHGRYMLARGLLQEAGIVDANGTRILDGSVRTVQLGDLANCVAADRDADLKVLAAASQWFDVLLLGNHEAPYLGGKPFAGFWRDPEVENAVKKLAWRPALAIGDTLLTHAGLAHDITVHGDTAHEVADECDRIIRHGLGWADPVFARVGRARGGYWPTGGVLWSDFRSEPRATWLSQVHGHTPMANGPHWRFTPEGRFAVNLDVGGHGDVRRIVGLWLDAAGMPDGPEAVVEYEIAAEVAA